MQSVGIYEAKSRFSALIELVEQGEEVRITRHGKEVVRMLPDEDATEKPKSEKAAAKSNSRNGKARAATESDGGGRQRQQQQAQSVPSVPGVKQSQQQQQGVMR